MQPVELTKLLNQKHRHSNITADKDNMIDLTNAECHLYSQVAKDGAIHF